MALFIDKIKINWGKLPEESYLREIPALRGLTQLTLHAPVTFFVGENGTGKSTLLEALAIAAGFNPEGGTRNYLFSTRDSHSPLYEAVTLSRSYPRPEWGYFLRAESFYNVATMEEVYSDLGHPSQHLHERSHGESFLAVAEKQIRPNGLYFMDEPEAALSPQNQLALLLTISRAVKGGAQFFVASHSPILLGLPDAEILTFEEGRVHPCLYEETSSYRVTEMFIKNRRHLLHHLLEED